MVRFLGLVPLAEETRYINCARVILVVLSTALVATLTTIWTNTLVYNVTEFQHLKHLGTTSFRQQLQSTSLGCLKPFDSKASISPTAKDTVAIHRPYEFGFWQRHLPLCSNQYCVDSGHDFLLGGELV